MRSLTIPLICIMVTACGNEAPQEVPARAASAAAAPTAGDAAVGRDRIDQYACLACHRIPGFDGPQGSLGPSLEGIGRRALIGGRVPNDPQTMTAFLQDPQAVDPQSRMMSIGVTAEDARHIAAYLFTLE